MRLTWPSRRPHYAWVVLACNMAVLAVCSAALFSFGVLLDPLVEEYGWSRGSVSFAYSLQFLVGIPTVLVAGRLAEKIGTRYIVMGGAVIFLIGALLTATVTELWQFQFYYGVLVGGLGSAAFVTVLPVLLTHWFNRKLGLAMGVMWIGMSLGPAVLAPLIRWSLETVGWSETFVVFGIAGGALMLMSGFFLREYPREKNLIPYGGQSTDAPRIDAGPSAEAFSLRQVTVMTSFWALVAVHALGCVGHSIPLAHMVSMGTFAGLSGVTAAGAMSVAATTSAISRLGIPLLAEKRGGKFTLILALLLQTLPILLLLRALGVPSFYTFAFLFGLGYGGEMVGFPIFNRQYYGKDAPQYTIYSYQVAGGMLGMAVGGWLGGALFDLTGVYTWSVLVAVAAGFLGIMAALTLPSYRAR